MFVGEIENHKRQVFKKRLLQYTLCGGAIVTLLSAVLNPRKPKNLLLSELGMSATFGFLAAYVSQYREEGEKDYKRLLTLTGDHKQQTWADEYSNHQTAKDIMNELKLADFIRGMPYSAQVRYMHMHNLQGLVALNPPKQPKTYETISVVSNQISELSIKENSDLDEWYTDDLVKQSNYISGKRGSGKTLVLKHICARLKTIVPDVLLCIIDVHYDPTNSEDLENDWLKGIPYEAKKAIIAHGDRGDYSDVVTMVKSINIEVRRRLDEKLRDEPLLVIFIDEWEAVLEKLTEPMQDLLVNTVKLIQNECRKNKIEISITTKSVKKEVTKLDSGTISQMNFLLYNNIIVDTTGNLPIESDIRRKAAKEIATLQINDKKERKAVFLDQNGDYRVVRIPLLPKIVFDQGEPRLESEPDTSSQVEVQIKSQTPPDLPKSDDINANLDKLFSDLVDWYVIHLMEGMELENEDIYNEWVNINGIDFQFTDNAISLFGDKVKEAAKKYFKNS